MGYLRKANLKDLNHVCENMREMDRLEAVYQTGQEPADALRLTYLAGEQVLTIAGDDDQPYPKEHKEFPPRQKWV